MTSFKSAFTAIKAAATRMLFSRANDPKSFSLDRDSGAFKLFRRRISLNRRQRRARVVLARVPKIVRWCRTSNGHSHGRLSV